MNLNFVNPLYNAIYNDGLYILMTLAIFAILSLVYDIVNPPHG